MASRALNLLGFLIKAPQTQFLRRRIKLKYLNTLHPNRRRCFYLAIKFPAAFSTSTNPFNRKIRPLRTLTAQGVV
jgi:hypothetical protein